MKNFKIFFLSIFVLGFESSSAQFLLSVPQAIQQQAQSSIYKIKRKNVDVNGTAFFVSPYLAITVFHGIGILDLENENFNDIELFKNSEKGLQWLKVAAENGHTQAQKALAEYSESNSSILEWIKELFTEEPVQ